MPAIRFLPHLDSRLLPLRSHALPFPVQTRTLTQPRRWAPSHGVFENRLDSDAIDPLRNPSFRLFPSFEERRPSYRMHHPVHVILSKNVSLRPLHLPRASVSNCVRSNAEGLNPEGDKSVRLSSPSDSPDPPLSPGALPSLVVASFYKFASLPDCEELRKPIKDLCEKNLVSGGIILAPEGINGSICGKREAVDAVLAGIRSDPRFSTMRHVEAPAGPEDADIHDRVTGQSEHSPLAAGPDSPFRWDHVRVKLKNEIVTLGMPQINPAHKVGKYVKPKDWNALISDPNTIVIDVRNHYEIRIGKFKGAVDPNTISFREFPDWIDEQLLKEDGSASNLSSDDQTPAKFHDEKEINLNEPLHPGPNEDPNLKEPNQLNEGRSSSPNRKIAMYCTGGIRCEKSTALLRHKGFDEVYHLEGGILKYLEEVPSEESLWEGECFVFDKRVSVGAGLKPGTYQLCYACKGPVTEEDKVSPLWEDGVSCPHCYHVKSEEEKARARARQTQFRAWGKIGGPHGGRKELARKNGREKTR